MLTVNEIGELYLRAAAEGQHRERAKGPKSVTTLELERTYLRTQVKPHLGHIEIAALTAGKLQEIINSIASSTSSGAASATRDLMRSIGNYAVHQGLVAENVAASTRAPGVQKRDPIVSDEHLGRIWRELGRAARCESDRSRPMTNALRMLILTGAHRDAVAGMLTMDIDLEARVWRVPAEQSGEKAEVVIPLSAEAMQVLRETIKLNEELVGDIGHVFPSLTSEHQGRKPVLPELLAAASLMVMKGLGVRGIRLHDLRRTVGEHLPKQLYPEAMDAWAQKLDRLARS